MSKKPEYYIFEAREDSEVAQALVMRNVSIAFAKFDQDDTFPRIYTHSNCAKVTMEQWWDVVFRKTKIPEKQLLEATSISYARCIYVVLTIEEARLFWDFMVKTYGSYYNRMEG